VVKNYAEEVESLKVTLPGETPWVTPLVWDKYNLMLGRINNHLVNTESHGFEFGDLVTFHLVDWGEFKCWEPSPHRKINPVDYNIQEEQ